MALLSEVIDGLKIFHKYGDGHEVCAEHDVLYAGMKAQEQLTDDERGRLEELGWHYADDVGSWACFV